MYLNKLIQEMLNLFHSLYTKLIGDLARLIMADWFRESLKNSWLQVGRLEKFTWVDLNYSAENTVDVRTEILIAQRLITKSVNQLKIRIKFLKH